MKIFRDRIFETFKVDVKSTEVIYSVGNLFYLYWDFKIASDPNIIYPVADFLVNTYFLIEETKNFIIDVILLFFLW